VNVVPALGSDDQLLPYYLSCSSKNFANFGLDGSLATLGPTEFHELLHKSATTLWYIA
jgi:hypothetical protein